MGLTEEAKETHSAASSGQSGAQPQAEHIGKHR